jgi:uncharacterized secreted protein with C-terminal beta-propeller domain
MQLRKTDLFTFIHKSIRSMIYNSASRLQSTDFSDAKESKEMLLSVRQDLELLHEHAEHEDNIIFPEIADNEPEMIKILNDEHIELESKLNKLLNQMNKIYITSNDEERLVLGEELNNMFNDFSASYLAHMNHEEVTVLEASFKYLSDDELIAIRTRIQTKFPAERYKIWLHWMLKSLNNSELVGLLGGMKASAPPQVFENVLQVSESVIDAERLRKIKLQVGVTV